jgi:hypothetical protein
LTKIVPHRFPAKAKAEAERIEALPKVERLLAAVEMIEKQKTTAAPGWLAHNKNELTWIALTIGGVVTAGLMLPR